MYELGLFFLLFFPLLLFISLGKYTKKTDVLITAIIVVFSSIMFSSRVHFLVDADDLIRYYDAYIQARSYGLFDYIKIINREWFYVGFNWLLYQVLGDISSHLYLFITSLAFNIFLATALFKIFNKKRYKLFVIMSILFIPVIGMHTQLVRQALAFTMLMMTIASSKTYTKVIFFILAIGVHKVTIIFYLILWSYKFCYRTILNPLILFLIPACCFVLGQYIEISNIVSLLQLIPGIGNKALYLSNIELSPLHLGAVSIVSILLYLLVVIKINVILPSLSEQEKKLLYVIFFILSFSLFFSFFSQISTRFIFLFLIFLPWFSVLCIQIYVKKCNEKAFLAMIYCFLILLFTRNLTLKYSGFSLFNGELTNKVLQ